MDLKKEIKLSDLFRRSAKPEPELAAPATGSDGEKKSLLKRDLKLSLGRRKPAGEAVAAAEAAPSEKKSLLKRDLSLGRKAGEREAKTKAPKEPKAPKRAREEGCRAAPGGSAHAGVQPPPEAGGAGSGAFWPAPV